MYKTQSKQPITIPLLADKKHKQAEVHFQFSVRFSTT